MKEPSFIDLKEDFGVFDQPDPNISLRTSSRVRPIIQVSINQEVTGVLEGMAIQNTSSNFLALLESHARVAPSKTPILPRPITQSLFSFLPLNPSKRREKKKKSKARILWMRGRSQISLPLSMLKELKLLSSIERRVPSMVQAPWSPLNADQGFLTRIQNRC